METERRGDADVRAGLRPANEYFSMPTTMKRKIENVILVLGLATVGCLPEVSGVDPPMDELIFPVGLAMAPSGKLLVANSNFDLKYNAGTLQAMDVSALDEAPGEFGPNQRYFYIDETSLALPEQTIRIGAFASDLELTPSKKRALIPVRGKRAVLIIDVDRGGKVISCGQGEDRECDEAHRVESNGDVSLPIEPYEVASFEYVRFDEALGKNEITTFGVTSHLAGGDVSLFVVGQRQEDPDDPTQVVETLNVPWLLRVADDVVSGASGIAANPKNNEIYVSGRRDSMRSVSILKLLTDAQNGPTTNNPYFSRTGRIELGESLYSGTDARGIVVDEKGERAYLVTRSPQALVALDLKTRQVTDMVSVGAEPSTVALLEGVDEQGQRFSYAFVLCFLADKVFVIDTALMQLVAVRTTGAGPQAIAFDEERKRAFIANFRESTISIIQAVEPFDYLRLGQLRGEGNDAANDDSDAGALVVIGKPTLPRGHD